MTPDSLRMARTISEAGADLTPKAVLNLLDHIDALQHERDEMALNWSNCAMRNAIALREIQLLAGAGLESGCVEGDDEYTLFTSIHRLSCEQQGTGSATPVSSLSTDTDRKVRE